ncbi:hypothetical protein N2152v2_006266 [Parachlorella kessleri]
MLTAVFQLLGNSELAALRLAAREFVSAASAAVTSLKPTSIAANLRPFGQLQALDLSGLRPDEWQEEMLAVFPKAGLTSLTLSKPTYLSLAGTEAIADLQCLRSMHIMEAPILDSVLQPLSRLSGLQHLSLRDCCKLSDEGLKVIAHMTCLESLDLSMVWQLTDATLAMLADSLTCLARLDLTSCERFTAAGLRRLCKLSSLKTLLMPACYQLTDECLEVVAGGMKQLRCLGLFEAGENVTDAGLLKLSSLSQLTALDLGYSCWGHSAQGLKQLLPRLKGLQMLNLGGCEGACDAVLSAVAGLRQLTQLDVSECQRVTTRAIQQLARLPQLASLNLGWNLKLSAAALAGFADSGSLLTQLDLSFCGEMGDEALGMLGALPKLKALCLRKCTRVGDKGLAHLGHCTSLEQLDLSYCPLITPEGLRHIASQLPLLGALRLMDCPRAVTVLGMRALGSAERLQSLHVGDNKRLDDGCMQAISFMSQLRSLVVRACPKITDHGLLALARITHLRDLDIDLCVAVTPAGVAKLQAKLPLLKRLRPSRGSMMSQLQASNSRLL